MPETMAMSPKVTIGTSTEVSKVTTEVTTEVAAAKVAAPAAAWMSERVRGNRQAAERQKCCYRKS
jgi:hypothetical protein